MTPLSKISRYMTTITMATAKMSVSRENVSLLLFVEPQQITNPRYVARAVFMRIGI